MTNRLSDMIWQRGDAREIMREARAHLRATHKENVAAHIGLASAHYSLVKRYLEGWRRLIGAWHMLRATSHAQYAAIMASHQERELSLDQVDVVTTILAKANRWARRRSRFCRRYPAEKAL